MSHIANTKRAAFTAGIRNARLGRMLVAGFVALFVSVTHSSAVDAAAQCTPSKHASIKITAGQKYNQVRRKLIAAGWQPLLINPMQREQEVGGNGPDLLKAGFDEVVWCYSTGLAGCEFRFSDEYSNVLVVETQGEIWEKNPFPGVTKFYFICE